MKRFTFFLPIVLMVVWGAGLVQITRWATETITMYRAPAVAAQSGVILGDAPQTERIVLVVLSGVGAQSLNDPANPFAFRTLRRLAAEGAWGISNAVVPTGDAATWTALVSGAPPAQSGVIQETQTSLDVETLLSNPERVVIVGSAAALKSRQGLLSVARTASAPSSDRVGDVAVEVLGNQRAPLNIVLLDLARRSQYSGSALWERLDQQLAAIVATLDPTRDTLLITADHGVLADQRFGGTEREIVETPFVLWGAQVRKIGLGRVEQIDVTPTVAVLFSAPLPRSSIGRPLVEALNLSPEVGATALLAAAEQRWTILASSAAPPIALETARAAVQNGDWSLATDTLQAGWLQLQRFPSSQGIGSEYVWGIGVPLVLLIAARLLAWRGRALARWLAVPALGLVVYLVAWLVIFGGLAGERISWSTLHPNPAGALLRTSVWAVLSLIVAVLPVAVIAAGRGVRQAVRDTLRLIVLLQLTGGLIGLLLWSTTAAPLAQLTAWAALLLVLTQLAATALAAPVAALVAAGVTEIFERGR